MQKKTLSTKGIPKAHGNTRKSRKISRRVFSRSGLFKVLFKSLELVLTILRITQIIVDFVRK